jgi:D-ribose pyranase
MKKTGILNQEMAQVIAGMGHYQKIIICDAGFPIPEGIPRIDLALTPGLPAFMDVLTTVMLELCVEEVIIAKETKENSPQRFEEMKAQFPGLTPDLIPHTEFKEISKTVKACIRSGECTPYSNIMLVSGVTY